MYMRVGGSYREREVEEKDRQVTYIVGHILDLDKSSAGVDLGDVDAARGAGADRSSGGRIIAGFLRGRFRGRHLLGAGTSTLLTWGWCQVKPEDKKLTHS